MTAEPSAPRPAAAAPPAAWHEHQAPLLLALIVALGFAARAWGITFGLPFDYHIDESPYAVLALNLRGNRYSPLFGPFQVILLAELWLLQLLAPLLGKLALPGYVDFAAASPAALRLVGRLTSAWLGAFTAIPVYLLGKRVWCKKVGLIAALLLALCFFHVRKSHYAVPDSAACFFVAWTVYACTFLGRTRSRWAYVAAGALAGLAVAAKQLTWPLVVTLVLYHSFPDPNAAAAAATPPRPRRRWEQHCQWCAAAQTPKNRWAPERLSSPCEAGPRWRFRRGR